MDSKILNKLQRLRMFNKILVCIVFLLLLINPYSVLADQEMPLEIPKMEGSKSFDFEISQINKEGILLFQKRKFEQAGSHFKKALNLAKQFRDPSRGILHFNYALSLHYFGNHKEALREFYNARKFARQNIRILQSNLLKMHECGLNPSITCDEKVPLELNIEGSH